MSQSPQNRDDRPAGTPPGTDAPSAKRAPLRDRKISLTLSLPKAIFSLFFSLFALVWVFIFGVMLGRGHNPEDVVPELARVMPTPVVPSNVPQNALTSESINDVLRPQDLQYHDSLKNADPAEKPRVPVPAPARPAAKPQTPPLAAPKPVPAAPSPLPAASARSEDKAVYNYIYQVAAFNNAAAAQTMQKKLRDGGISVRVAQTESNGTVWYRLLVPFKGSPEETRTLRTKLAPYGISSIILRGKTPVQ